MVDAAAALTTANNHERTLPYLSISLFRIKQRSSVLSANVAEVGTTAAVLLSMPAHQSQHGGHFQAARLLVRWQFVTLALDLQHAL